MRKYQQSRQNQKPSFSMKTDGSNTGLVEGTDEQKAIWAALLDSTQHVIVEAVAGSGKTFTLVQYALRERQKRIGLVAFNKHIAEELTRKIGGQANVECMTYHSLGFRAVRMRQQNCRVDQYKVLSRLDTVELSYPSVDGKPRRLLSREEQKTAKYRIASMVGFAKSAGYDWTVTREQLDYLADRYDVDMNGLTDVILAAVPGTLKWCADNLATIDFNDMVWLPKVLNLPVPRYDVLCVDEYQDTDVNQQWIALRAGVRVCAVGDPHQAIYGFRGADSKGFERLRQEMGENVVTLPLTLTRRCVQTHVELAQRIVPQIRAMDSAPQGRIEYKSLNDSLAVMRPGDLVVCRVNAPLLTTAYKLLRRGVRAVVRGRDVGQGLTKLLEESQKAAGAGELSLELQLVIRAAASLTAERVQKFLSLPNGKGEMRAAAARDKYDCLSELSLQCERVSELKSLLVRLFEDFEADGKPNAVVLGTVHRTK